MMTRSILVAALAISALAGCKEDQAALPAPIEMTADALGYYCQMNLLDHDGPKGQIHLNGMPAPIFFSQVKDTLSYLHMPEQSHAVAVAYVQDMRAATWDNPGPWMPVEEAFFVVGSDALGGMDAPEIVPFSTQGEADAFALARGGSVKTFEALSTADTLDAQPDYLPPISDGVATDSDVGARLSALKQTANGTPEGASKGH